MDVINRPHLNPDTDKNVTASCALYHLSFTWSIVKEFQNSINVTLLFRSVSVKVSISFISFRHVLADGNWKTGSSPDKTKPAKSNVTVAGNDIQLIVSIIKLWKLLFIKEVVVMKSYLRTRSGDSLHLKNVQNLWTLIVFRW